ncbi:MAG: 30S ribosomal protein S21 [Patescibacteria group bacterium]|nr:30S ribosomal protein S21 [Patescibacteria group bacterium]
MIVVVKKKGETKDSLFRKFSKMFLEEEILTTVRKKQFYKKPSIIRKEQEKERRKTRALRRGT